MIRKACIRLTFFCALASGLILLVMTGICLHLSERGIREKNYADFRSNVSGILSYIENQSVISYTWLSKMEYNYHVSIDIRDGDTPLLYGTLSHTEQVRELLELVRGTASREYALDPAQYGANRILPRQEIFSVRDADNTAWHAAAALIPRLNGYLNVAILHSTAPVSRQISEQRLLFGCGAFFAWVLLTFFCWIFIRRMLLPIEENRRRQTLFVASASHELRSPLAVMLSALSAARIASPTERAHFLDTIEAEGGRMSRLIGDMLILANSDSRSWSIRPAPAEADTLLLETYEKYEPLARVRELAFSVQLPDAPIPALLCDRERIAQALSILIDNALSYTPAGGRVKLSLGLSGKYLVFSVSDNGPGIPDSQKKRVFERFHRLDGARKDRDHFGLGLCIAKEIVSLHKGKIRVTDTPGGGATFEIWLEADPSDTPAALLKNSLKKQ